MSLLQMRGIEKVWLDDRLIWDRATDARSLEEALSLELHGGAEDANTGFGDGCTNEQTGTI